MADTSPPGLLSRWTRISPGFLTLAAILLAIFYLTWTLVSLTVIGKRKRAVRASSRAGRLLQWFLGASFDPSLAHPDALRRRTVTFSLVHPIHEFEPTDPPTHRSGDIRRSNVDTLSDKVIAQELALRNLDSHLDAHSARTRLRQTFAAELRAKLALLGFAVADDLTDNVAVALRLDLAETLLRRARLALANAEQPSTMTDVEVDRELDARDVMHHLDGVARVAKVHALEVALAQETARPFGSLPPPVEDEETNARVRALLPDLLKDELGKRGAGASTTRDIAVDFEALFLRDDVREELVELEKMVGSRRLEVG